MDWYLNRALTNFRAAVNAAYPNRDKTSDGTIGDAAHQSTNSDHNPDSDGSVDAWDMDVDLRSKNDSAAIEELKKVFQAHPAARYWIHNRQIAHRSKGWKREPYTGSNPHDKHVHWNSEPAYENSTQPWVIPSAQEDDMPTAKEIAEAVWAADEVLAVGPPYNNTDYFKSDGKTLNNTTWTAKYSAQQAVVAGRAALAETKQLRTEVAALRAEVAKLTVPGTPGDPVVITDEQLERVLRRVLGMAPGGA